MNQIFLNEIIPILKRFNSEFQTIEVWFTDQNHYNHYKNEIFN